jgi:hypothetical protein
LSKLRRNWSNQGNLNLQHAHLPLVWTRPRHPQRVLLQTKHQAEPGDKAKTKAESGRKSARKTTEKPDAKDTGKKDTNGGSEAKDKPKASKPSAGESKPKEPKIAARKPVKAKAPKKPDTANLPKADSKGIYTLAPTPAKDSKSEAP